MSARHVSALCLVTASVAFSAGVGLERANAAQPGPAGVDLFMGGPVHEAYSGTPAFDPQRGMVAPKAPPQNIEELPPEPRPAGENVTWIPGYWNWDNDRNDYLWVSGIWRAMPPGRRWVPGYWARAGQGYQRTSGYWAGAAARVDVLTRGPVHEAFAGAIAFDPRPGIVVPKAPPDIIDEWPPDQRPEEENVTWIPGYWGWDDDRNDYVWVSGVWRALPPARQWVPGYWALSRQGYQWIPGYWADAAISEVEYYPAPPPTVEAGPNIPTPSPDHVWIPGHWVWHHGRYAWRPGCWMVAQPNWVWVPAYYVWAPRGYIFVEGYWDYSVGRRGILFAPMYFDPGERARPAFHYSPSVVIDLVVFTDHLFVRPEYAHYYFGDYYAPSYRNGGFHASFSFHSGRHGYDPIYAHQRWEHRKDHEWERGVRSAFEHRRDHEDARPLRTLAAQITLATSERKSTDRSLMFAASLEQVAKRKELPIRFRSVAEEEKQQLTKRHQEVQKFRGERQQLESQALPATGDKPARLSEPAKVRVRRSPIVGRLIDRLDKDRAFPQRPDSSKSDVKAEPKAGKADGSAEPVKEAPNVKRVERAQQPKDESKDKDKEKDKEKEKQNDKPRDK